MHDERDFTPWAEPGWHAYNAMAPEVEWCEWVGRLTRDHVPTDGLVVETGSGGGYVTRQIITNLPHGSKLLAYEEDPAWRLPECHRDKAPAAAVLAKADLTVLDSEPPLRYEELINWRAAAKPGALLVVHDTGTAGHSPISVHLKIRRAVQQLGVPGWWFTNPRGSFMGVQI